MRALIFDCFGVLVTDGWRHFQAAHFSDNPTKMTESTDLQKQFDVGFIEYKEFITSAAALANVSPGLVDITIRNNQLDKQLIKYIAELKQTYVIGMLSNAGTNFLHEFMSAKEILLFDEVVLSGEIGAIKPTAAAYEITARRLDVSPDDCVFIDDQPANCHGAEQVGMVAINYTDFVSFKKELQKYL